MLAAITMTAGAALLASALHPFTTYPVSLALLARTRPRPVATGMLHQSAALCVCAYNEEAVIHGKAMNMLAMQEAFPALELLIYVDAGTDRTAEILEEFKDRIQVVVASKRTGKTAGMNTLIGRTNADCLVFSDANVVFAQDAVPKLLAPFADPSVGVVCGHLRYSPDAGNTTAATGSLYWRLEESIKRLESATGSVMGADGSIFAMRRTAHHFPPADLIDDMYNSLRALCDGARIVRAEDAFAYEDQVSHQAEEFGRKIRISCQAFNVHRQLWPRLKRLPALDLYKYVSHKLLRWMVIYLLGAGALLFGLGLALAAQWWLLGAASVLGLAMLASGQVRSILLAFVGTGLGVARSLKGDRFQTWSPPASSRTLATPHAASR